MQIPIELSELIVILGLIICRFIAGGYLFIVEGRILQVNQLCMNFYRVPSSR